MFDQRIFPEFIPQFAPDDKRHNRKGERNRFDKVCKHEARKVRPTGDELLALYANHPRSWIAEEFGVGKWQVSQWIREASGW